MLSSFCASITGFANDVLVVMHAKMKSRCRSQSLFTNMKTLYRAQKRVKNE